MAEGFGKRGMGWHGIAAIYYEWDDHVKFAVRKILYLDQILHKNNKQDTACVASLLEVFVSAIVTNFGSRDGGFIPKAVVCSDNAGCYTSNLLILMIGLLNATHADSLFIEQLIHSETQDGKGLVDAHFATSKRHLTFFIKNSVQNQIRNIKTPRGLARALAWNNGICNSIVQLVDVDRDRVEKISEKLTPICKKLSKYFSRVSEVTFQPPTAREKEVMKNGIIVDDPDNTILQQLHECNLRFRIRAHCGFGTAILITVNFENMTVTPEQKGLDEMNRYFCLEIDDDDNLEGVEDEEDSEEVDENEYNVDYGEYEDEEYSDDESEYEDVSDEDNSEDEDEANRDEASVSSCDDGGDASRSLYDPVTDREGRRYGDQTHEAYKNHCITGIRLVAGNSIPVRTGYGQLKRAIKKKE